jgi:Bacteriocin-protection, YdeI or OmpD-Associated
MTGWVTFDGRVVPLTWGRATYTILPIPAGVVTALGKTRRVEGEIAEHPVNLALSRAPVVEGVFLWTGQSLLDRIAIQPGEPVEVRLRPAPDDRVDLDPDIEAALRAGGMLDQWEALTPGKRRGLLYQIGTAKTETTRRKRIQRLVEDLS